MYREKRVRDAGAGGSNPLTPTRISASFGSNDTKALSAKRSESLDVLPSGAAYRRHKTPNEWDELFDDEPRAEAVPKTTSFVYIISCGGFVKIGWSSDPKARLSHIKTSSPHPTVLVATFEFFPGEAEKAERFLHQKLKRFHRRGEWFALSADLAEYEVSKLVCALPGNRLSSEFLERYQTKQKVRKNTPPPVPRPWNAGSFAAFRAQKGILTAFTIAAGVLLGAANAHAASFGPYAEETYIQCGNPNSTVAVALMHGGWDVGGTYDNNWNIAQACKALKNVAVYAFNYRLAKTKGQGWPAQWQDAQLMVRFLRARGYAKVGFMGISAGAYNALGITFSQATIKWKQTDPAREAERLPNQSSLPDFTVAVSPFSNFNAPGLSPIATKLITADLVLGGIDQQTANGIASPITRMHPASPPVLLIHGLNDTLVPVGQSQTLCQDAAFINVRMTCDFTNGKHVFGGYTDTDLNLVLGKITWFVAGVSR